MLDYVETGRLVLASSKGVEFLKGGRRESGPGKRELYFFDGGRNELP